MADKMIGLPMSATVVDTSIEPPHAICWCFDKREAEQITIALNHRDALINRKGTREQAG
jgi:hypothetical protein